MSYWDGKTALITGGSAGFGNALAWEFADRGADVAIAGREADKLQRAVDALAQAGHNALGVQADVTDSAQVDEMICRTAAQFGRLDVLVNNVGRSTRGKVVDTTAEQFRALLELNFLSVVRCTQAALPHLRKSKGHLINIGSLAAKTVAPFLGAYPASKFAIAAYSQQLRFELTDEGVHVLLVCPGPIARGDAGRRYAAESAELPDAARQPGGGVRLRGIAPGKLANKVLRACERRQCELIVPARARLLFTLSQLSPSLGDWVIRRMRS